MYLRNVMTQLQRATNEGVPVKGNFVSSAIDNLTPGFYLLVGPDLEGVSLDHQRRLRCAAHFPGRLRRGRKGHPRRAYLRSVLSAFRLRREDENQRLAEHAEGTRASGIKEKKNEKANSTNRNE